jgi:hypothetical protein
VADPEKPPQAPAKEAGFVAESPSAAAAKPQRKKLQTAVGQTPKASPAADPNSPRTRKSPERHTAPAAAIPELTTPTTPTATTAELSPELGLGLAQALSAELAGLSQRLLEAGSASAQQLASARSVPELIQIQARQLKSVSEAWLEHTSRISEIYRAAVGPRPDSGQSGS